MPSLRKIARMVGVAPSTVTRALRDDPRIGAATRARIQALAAQYHYLPNRLTQSLMTGRSYTLGVLLPSVVTPYSARLLSGVLHDATAAGYRVLIQESNYQLSQSLAAIQMLIEQRVDGILLDCGHLDPLPRNTILEMRGHQVLPVGLDATTVDGQVDHVHTDEQAMATQAVDYLVQLGHRRIAFVGQTEQGRPVGRGLHVQQALRQRLLPTRYYYDTQTKPPYERLPSEALLARILREQPAPTALIAWEDPLAALLITAAGRRGVPVPRQLSVLAFGNLDFSRLLTPTLTTFEQHPEAVGQQAFALFSARAAADPADELPPRSLAIRPTFIIRESCAPPGKG